MTHISLESPEVAPGRPIGSRQILAEALERRREQTARLAGSIDALCAACVDLAGRIAAGGRLFVLGSGRARADARHLALEFLHPVIVGKRAVPALALDPADPPCDVDRLGSPADVVIAVAGPESAAEVWRAFETAHERGLLGVALASTPANGATLAAGTHWLDPGASDPLLAKEGRVASYHLLWELTHVMLEESERLGAPDAALGQLYPFLGASPANGESLRADLRASGVGKLRTLEHLRAAAVDGHAEILERCAEAIGDALRDGAQLFSFGNGGSQTDAEWIAGWFAAARVERPWRARSLACDPSVLTALANDVGFERVFARQIAAFAAPGDIALGISTSGSSENVVAGLAEAKRRGLVTVGLAGGDGGRLARSADVDFLFVVPSDSVHRIQEVQATLYHLLYELAQREGACDS